VLAGFVLPALLIVTRATNGWLFARSSDAIDGFVSGGIAVSFAGAMTGVATEPLREMGMRLKIRRRLAMAGAADFVQFLGG